MKFRFSSFEYLLKILAEEKIGAEDYAIKRESFISGKSEADILIDLDRRIAVTRAALDRGRCESQRSLSGLTDGAAVKFATRSRVLVSDDLFSRAIGYALAVNEVNACGGKVVAFPTAGSSGIVPGAIWAWWDTRGPGGAEPPYDERLRGAFLNASLVGVLIAQNATLAGSEGGCQAECGAAGAMASAAIAFLEGLSLEQRFGAAALALKNSLGLACDPIAGLVEVPCVKRNAFVAAASLVAVELVLAGIESAVPFDEVVAAMKSIGDSLPQSIKENAEGGLAATATGIKYKAKMAQTQN
ncbi:MAG: L-serine ammonia-lyase, iron-sulfur-dependent, subunit alpha [Treponemataceae bacterium]